MFSPKEREGDGKNEGVAERHEDNDFLKRGCTMMKPAGDKILSVFSALILFSLFAAGFLVLPGVFADEISLKGDTSDGIYYIVREGDCLWNISGQFYRDPWVWPLVWGNNEYISNPHWIYPGDSIYLAYEPGGMTDTESTKGIGKPLSPVSSMVTTLRIPRSLADIALVNNQGIVGAGWVLTTPDERTMVSEGDEVYLQIPESSQVSDTVVYQILRPLRKIRHPHTGKKMGTLYRMMGSARILSQDGSQVARARIVDSRGAIKTGDFLVAGLAPQKAVYSKRASRDMQGSVIAGLRFADNIAQHDICFIDKGILDGVEVGDTFWVMEPGKKVKKFGERGKLRLPEKKIALLVVIHAEKTASTALVADSKKTFDIGVPVKSRTESDPSS